MKHVGIYIFLSLFITVTIIRGNEKEITPDSIPEFFLQQQNIFPQEKIYVQTDKSNYLVGDTIWFRAFLVDACMHTLSTLSNFVYADLLDPHNRLVDRIKIIKENGIFQGYLDLPEDLHSGDYRLCVYTRYMYKEQKEYLFQKKLTIDNYISMRYSVESVFKSGDKKGELIADLHFKEFNNGKSIIPDKVEFYEKEDKVRQVPTVQDGHFVFKLEDTPPENMLHFQYTIGGRTQGQYIYIPASKKDYDVSFFPEGGELPGGTQSRIAFKALNTDGLGEDIRGVVLNSLGDTVVKEFRSLHLGMGIIRFFYDPSLSYYMVCWNRQGLKKEYTLPSVTPNACTLSAYWRKDNLYISINKDSRNTTNKPLYLTILCRGKILYSKRWEKYWEDGNSLRFSQRSFPTGVLQLLLTDENNLPLSERLVFSLNKGEKTVVNFQTNKKYYSSREQVKAKIEVLDQQNIPLSTTLSVSVTDPNVVRMDTGMNILSTLLLTSELKGYIESPAYYFSGDYAEKQEELDALLLTQGWSRYKIAEVLQGKAGIPGSSPETFQQIKGMLYQGISQNKPAPNYPVRLFATASEKFVESETQENGSFCFDNILFADGTIFVVQGSTPKGKSQVLLEVEKDSLGITVNPFPLAVREPKREWIQAETEKKIQILSQGDIARTYQLGEVEVTASRIKKRPFFYMSKSPYSSEFNKSISGKDLINRYHPGSVMEMLQHLTGVSIWRDGPTVYPYIPSENPFNAIPPPRAYLLMDNVPIDANELNALMPQYIAEMEVVKGGRIATMGANGVAGAILITTSMLPVDQKVVSPTNIQTIAPIGYQVIKEFYSPKYEAKEQKNYSQRDNRSTLYWSPDVRTTESKSGEFQFYTSDQTFSPYVIVLEGLSEEGKLIYWKGEISVK